MALAFVAGIVVIIGSADLRPTAQTLSSDERAQLTARVRDEFQHAWSSYKRLAWGHDELNPVSRTVHDWYPPAVVYMTPVDALDTMTLMWLSDEAGETRRYLLDHLSFDQDVSVQVFEVTIRLLGGLL